MSEQVFRFLHAGDLHLERPPLGLAEVPDRLRESLADAPYRAAQRVFDVALTELVDFVVLAGDVVDPVAAGPRSLVFLAQQAERLAERGIPIYWATGRVDASPAWRDKFTLPNNVRIFAGKEPESALFSRDGVPLAEIVAAGRTNKRVNVAGYRRSTGAFAISIAHGDLDADAVDPAAVDYWALGGRHNRQSLRLDPPVAHYTGSPQARRPKEHGPHGCTLVSVDANRRVRTSFVATDCLRWCPQRIAVQPSTTPEQLGRMLMERAEAVYDGAGPDLLVNWLISGAGPLLSRSTATTSDLVDRLRAQFGAKRPALWTLAIENADAAELPTAWAAEDTILGEFLRHVDRYAGDPALPIELKPYLSERHIAGRVAASVDLNEPAARREVLDEVARLGVDLLSGGGS